MKEHQNLTYILWHRILKGFADAMVKVFIPLLIFKATGDFRLSLLYCIITYALGGIFFIILKKIITRYPVLCIIIHIIPLIAIQFLISNINVITIIIIAVIDAIATTLYYGSLNLIFGLKAENTNTAKFESAEHIGRIFFIALSATLLGEVQNSLLFITIFAGCMYVLSAIPLLIKYKTLSKDIRVTSNAKPFEILKETKYFNLYHSCFGVLNVFTAVFLPLYLYAKGLSFTATGLIHVLQEILCVIGAYVAKIFSKYKNEKLYVILSSIIIGVCLVLILFLSNIVAIYILTLLISFFSQGIFVLLLQCFIDDQKAKGYFQDSNFYRDVFQNFSRMGTCGICMIGLFSPVMFAVGILFSGGVCYTGIKCLNRKDKNIVEQN